MDYGYMGEVFSMTGATVDQVLDVRPPLFSIDACAFHTTSGTATVSFELREF
jgi:hypothetical protein